VLARLLRTHLRPYRRPLAAVVVLQLIGTIASLYLPSLNAQIIDRGIAAGDTGLILRLGGVMLLISLVQVACSVAAVHHGSRTATGFGADVRESVFHRVGGVVSRRPLWWPPGKVAGLWIGPYLAARDRTAPGEAAPAPAPDGGIPLQTDLGPALEGAAGR